MENMNAETQLVMLHQSYTNFNAIRKANPRAAASCAIGMAQCLKMAVKLTRNSSATIAATWDGIIDTPLRPVLRVEDMGIGGMRKGEQLHIITGSNKGRSFLAETRAAEAIKGVIPEEGSEEVKKATLCYGALIMGAGDIRRRVKGGE